MTNISLKEVLLTLFSTAAVIGSFIFWRSTTQLIANEMLSSYWQFALSAGVLAVAASLFGIAAIFIRNAWILYPPLLASTIVPFLFLTPIPLTYAMMGISLALLIFALRRIRKEFNLTFGFSVAIMFKGGVPLFLTIFGLILSLFYLNDVQSKDAIRAIFPRAAFNISVKVLGNPLKALVGGDTFSPDETVDTFFTGLVKKQLADRGINSNQVSRKEMQQMLAATRAEIARSYGIKLKGDEKLGDVFYTTIIERISDILGPYRAYVPFASAIAFFLAFKTLAFFLYFFIIGIAFLLIRFMILMGVITRKKEQVEVEKLALSEKN